MPYEVKRSGDCPPDKPFGVFKKGTTEKLGCHASEAQANQQLKALYAQEARELPSDSLAEGTFKGREVMSAAEAVFTDVVDEATGRAQLRADVVIIKPGESVNRRFYTQEAIDRAIESGFWEGSPMFIDHPSDLRIPTKRSITTLAAGLSNVRRGPHGEAIGTATFFNREFGLFAMEAKDHVGVSGVHYFKGQRYRGTDGHYHERVDEFLANNSVDFVAHAAAGGGILNFLPAMESEDDVAYEEITPELLKKIHEQRPDLHAAFVSVAGEGDEGDPDPEPDPKPDPDPKPEEAKGVTEAEIAAMIAQGVESVLTARDKKADDRAAVAKKAGEVIGKSGLPEPVRARVLADVTAKATVETVESLATEAIETAKAEGKSWAPPRVSNMGPSVPTPAAAGDTKPISIKEAAAESAAIGHFFGGWVADQQSSGKEN